MRDLYKHMGVKKRTESIDTALIEIRKKYPHAYMEGSAGLGRHYFIRENDQMFCVGHCWSSGIRNHYSQIVWWYRVFNQPVWY